MNVFPSAPFYCQQKVIERIQQTEWAYVATWLHEVGDVPSDFNEQMMFWGDVFRSSCSDIRLCDKVIVFADLRERYPERSVGGNMIWEVEFAGRLLNHGELDSVDMIGFPPPNAVFWHTRFNYFDSWDSYLGDADGDEAT